jgi:hypothetical protein
MEHLEDIKAKLLKLEKLEQQRKDHIKKCMAYQKKRRESDEEFKNKLYEMSREYQKNRYNEDPEFREAKLKKMRERYHKKKESLGDEKANFQKFETPEKDQK